MFSLFFFIFILAINLFQFSTNNNVFASLNSTLPLITNPVNIGNDISKINGSNTFFAKGLISTVLFQNSTKLKQNVIDTVKSFQSDPNHTKMEDISLIYGLPKIASGTWTLNVTGGKVVDFHSIFKLITTNGFEKLFLEISNFKNKDPVIFHPLSFTSVKGVADLKINNQLFESNFQIELKIFKINTLIIDINNKDINEILYNNTLMGISDSLKNFKNDELLVFNSN